jgi:hypothetical protein
MPVPESLPLLDLKASALLHNQLYSAGEHIDDLLGLPEGFVDPKRDKYRKALSVERTYSSKLGGFVTSLR